MRDLLISVATIATMLPGAWLIVTSTDTPQQDPPSPVPAQQAAAVQQPEVVSDAEPQTHAFVVPGPVDVFAQDVLAAQPAAAPPGWPPGVPPGTPYVECPASCWAYNVITGQYETWVPIWSRATVPYP